MCWKLISWRALCLCIFVFGHHCFVVSDQMLSMSFCVFSRVWSFFYFQVAFVYLFLQCYPIAIILLACSRFNWNQGWRSSTWSRRRETKAHFVLKWGPCSTRREPAKAPLNSKANHECLYDPAQVCVFQCHSSVHGHLGCGVSVRVWPTSGVVMASGEGVSQTFLLTNDLCGLLPPSARFLTDALLLVHHHRRAWTCMRRVWFVTDWKEVFRRKPIQRKHLRVDVVAVSAGHVQISVSEPIQRFFVLWVRFQRSWVRESIKKGFVSWLQQT